MEIEVCTKPVTSMEKGDMAKAKRKPCQVVGRKKKWRLEKNKLMEVPESQINDNKG